MFRLWYFFVGLFAAYSSNNFFYLHLNYVTLHVLKVTESDSDSSTTHTTTRFQKLCVS